MLNKELNFGFNDTSHEKNYNLLEELYLDKPAIVMVDGNLATSRRFTGWINYLFNENYSFKNEDPWKVFEAMREGIKNNIARRTLKRYMALVANVKLRKKVFGF